MYIIDIDGTIAHPHPDRLKFVEQEKPDWDNFLTPSLVRMDLPIPEAQRVLAKIKGAKIVFLTGRNESLREVTTEWIKEHFNIDTSTYNLKMRPVNNFEKPTVYKRGQLEQMLIPAWYKAIAIDDDIHMIDTYYALNIMALHAPKCWDHMLPRFDLPEEGYWRK